MRGDLPPPTQKFGGAGGCVHGHGGRLGRRVSADLVFGNQWGWGSRIWKGSEELRAGKTSPTLPGPTGPSKTVYKNGDQRVEEKGVIRIKSSRVERFFFFFFFSKRQKTTNSLGPELPKAWVLPRPLKLGRSRDGERGEAGCLKSHPWTGRLFVFGCLPLPPAAAGLPRRDGEDQGYAGKLSFFPFRTLVI